MTKPGAKDFSDLKEAYEFNVLKIPGLRKYEFKDDDLEYVKQLGAGAYGIVKKYKHMPTGKEMAFKFVGYVKKMKGDELAKLELQLELHKKLGTPGHANIVQIYGHLVFENQLVIAMEAMSFSLKDLYQKIHKEGKFGSFSWEVKI